MYISLAEIKSLSKDHIAENYQTCSDTTINVFSYSHRWGKLPAILLHCEEKSAPNLSIIILFCKCTWFQCLKKCVCILITSDTNAHVGTKFWRLTIYFKIRILNPLYSIWVSLNFINIFINSDFHTISESSECLFVL